MEGAESFLRSSISVVEDIFMAESYGLSKSEYRKYIDDPTVSAKMLSKKIVKPKRVYRYRRLGHEDNGTWVENTFWQDDVNGICLFSVPDSFNKNDDNDCKVRFDNYAVFEYMFFHKLYFFLFVSFQILPFLFLLPKIW